MRDGIAGSPVFTEERRFESGEAMHLFGAVIWLHLTVPFHQLLFGDKVLTRW